MICRLFIWVFLIHWKLSYDWWTDYYPADDVHYCSCYFYSRMETIFSSIRMSGKLFILILSVRDSTLSLLCHWMVTIHELRVLFPSTFLLCLFYLRRKKTVKRTMMEIWKVRGTITFFFHPCLSAIIKAAWWCNADLRTLMVTHFGFSCWNEPCIY